MYMNGGHVQVQAPSEAMGTGFLGARVTGCSDPPTWGLGTELRSSAC